MPKSITARLVAVACLAAGSILLGVLAWHGLRGGGERAPDSPAGTAAQIGGPFELTDQFGQRRSEAGFRGRFMLVYFGFTSCPDICPTELQTMSNAIDMLGAEGERVTPVFVTVDPARDTAEVMRLYAANFHPRLVALTGSEAEIAAAAKAYRIYYARVEGEGGDYSMDHSSVVYLMAPDGGFLTHFAHDTGAEQMAEAMRDELRATR